MFSRWDMWGHCIRHIYESGKNSTRQENWTYIEVHPRPSTKGIYHSLRVARINVLHLGMTDRRMAVYEQIWIDWIRREREQWVAVWKTNKHKRSSEKMKIYLNNIYKQNKTYKSNIHLFLWCSPCHPVCNTTWMKKKEWMHSQREQVRH